MICPQCGYDMGNRNKCMRCGYEVKTLVAVDPSQKKDDEAKVIDPADVFISNGADDFDDSFGDPFDPFSMLFGNIFDPIGDLLGGLFGLDARTSNRSHVQEPEREPKTKKQGKVVEINNVEFLDENGNPINNNKKTKKSNGKNSKDKK